MREANSHSPARPHRPGAKEALLKRSTFLLRISLGLLFCLAGFFKLADQPAFFAALMKFELFDANTTYLLTWVLGGLELGLGLWIVSGFLPFPAAIAGFLMVLGFTAILFLSWARGLEVDCACFGPLQFGTGYGAWFFRNTFLGLVFLWLAWRCRPNQKVVVVGK